MILDSVQIRRLTKGYAVTPKPSDPFEATVKVVGDYGEVKLRLSPELSRRVIEIVADEVANAGRATADMMVAEALDIVATPLLETTNAAQ
jgi:hypothetical protein